LKNNNQLRIIGGRWRGRRISFPDVIGLRPSGDRIRETLFNWLQNTIHDAVCLDLFSGSGILGFEALSRGAAQVTFVDQHPVVIKHLQGVSELLAIDEVRIIRADVPSSPLQKQLSGTQYNLVFLDPPFHQGLVDSTCAWLANANLLAPDALIYIEAERTLDPLPLPEHWNLLKSKATGQVGYHLIQVPTGL
jgi:16S rRNA (guanine966-N2)-methyltransferase